MTHNMTTFTNISYDEFKREVSEFFKATSEFSNVNIDSLEAGVSAVNLLWLGRTDWTNMQVHESLILLDLVTKRDVDVRIEQMI